MPAVSLNIGLIGAGRIGQVHAEHLSTRIASARLLMVADAYEPAARQCAERYRIPAFTQDYRAILERPDIQAVVICSSTDTHAQIIEEAALAGRGAEGGYQEGGPEGAGAEAAEHRAVPALADVEVLVGQGRQQRQDRPAKERHGRAEQEERASRPASSFSLSQTISGFLTIRSANSAVLLCGLCDPYVICVPYVVSAASEDHRRASSVVMGCRR